MVETSKEPQVQEKATYDVRQFSDPLHFLRNCFCVMQVAVVYGLIIDVGYHYIEDTDNSSSQQ